MPCHDADISEQGNGVALIELDPVKKARIEEALDVLVALGNGVYSFVAEPAGPGGAPPDDGYVPGPVTSGRGT